MTILDRSDFISIRDIFTELDLLLAYERFPWNICDGCSMLIGDAYSFGHLVPSHLWHFQYSLGPHQVSSLHIYTFVVSRAFMAGAASQAGNADSSRAPGLTSCLKGSVNIHRGALLLVLQWPCISSFVFCIWQILFSNLSLFFRTMHFQYPSVLARFC